MQKENVRYRAIRINRPCAKCGEGESWAVEDITNGKIPYMFEEFFSKYSAMEAAQCLNDVFKTGMLAAKQ